MNNNDQDTPSSGGIKRPIPIMGLILHRTPPVSMGGRPS